MDRNMMDMGESLLAQEQMQATRRAYAHQCWCPF